MKRVIIGCDSYHDYSFFLPLSCVLWESVCGVRPYLFLVDDGRWSAPAYSFCLDTIRRSTTAELLLVPVQPWISSSFLAKALRVYGTAGTPSLSESMCITSDADMWPVQSKWFDQVPELCTKMWVLGANAYSPERKFPICYLAGLGKTFSDLTGCRENCLDGILSYVKGEYEAFKRRTPAARMDITNWDDEAMLEPKWSDSFVHGRCELISRDFDGSRLDRDGSNKFIVRDPHIDAHLSRPGYGHNWTNGGLMRLFQVLCPSRAAWANEYEREFTRLIT